MVKLVVAEKPSVARDLAKVLGAKGKGEGFHQGGNWWVTWCMGHMVELCEPQEYKPEWKSWSPAQLPMLPDPFLLQPRKDVGKHWGQLKKLLHSKEVEEVINACDAGREGELIFRFVYDLAGCKKPVRRLWLSSLTDEAIQDGLKNMKPSAAFDDLAAAARCRSEADWLVGMNATRAMTLLARKHAPRAAPTAAKQGPNLMSIGRVQTPTLAMIVSRELEIADFKPEPFWQVFATFEAEAGTWEAQWHKGQTDRFDDEAKAKAVADAVRGQTGRVTKVVQKEVKEKPPLLHDLTQLQRLANQRYGLSAARTLEVAQALYEQHKLLTYPRTDSNYLTSDMEKDLPKILRGISVQPYDPFCQHLLQAGPLKAHGRIINDKEVGDHHAIIPTGRKPDFEKLDRDEQRVFDLVARRFLAVFYPDAIFATTRIETEVVKHLFVASGRVRKLAGWQEVEPPLAPPKEDSKHGDAKEVATLPDVKQGDAAQVIQDRVHKGMTQPPKRYNEAGLLRSMELAGKELEDEELRRAMKDGGIGTPATRASIIETLLRREYIERKGKNLVPTPQGQALVLTLPVEVLKSPKLTGSWEEKLSRVALGQYTRQSFMAEVRDFTAQTVKDILRASGQPSRPVVGGPPAGGPTAAQPSSASGAPQTAGLSAAPAGASLGNCPVCGKPVYEGAKAYSCESGRSCSFVIFKTIAGKNVRDRLVSFLLSGQRTQVFQGFKSKAGKTFAAALQLNAQGQVELHFDNHGHAPSAPSASASPRTLVAAPQPSDPAAPSANAPSANAPSPNAPRDPAEPSAEREAPAKKKRAAKPKADAPSADAHGEDAPSAAAQAPSAEERAPKKKAPKSKAKAGDPAPADPAPPAAPSADAPSTARADREPLSQAPEALSQAPDTFSQAPYALTQAPVEGRTCPLCDQGALVKGRRGWGCSRWREGCKFVLWFDQGGLTLEEPHAHALLDGAPVHVEGPDGGATLKLSLYAPTFVVAQR